VQRLNNAGLYVILDLHWNAPGTNVANGQQVMADLDHGPAFWELVAATFKAFPAIIFDLYNEPHDISWDCWKNGCQVPDGWSTAGMAQLVAVVRGAGATQPLMLGGLNWAKDLSQWLAFKPVDPIEGPEQLVASYHTYCGPPGTDTVAKCEAALPSVKSEWPAVTTVASSVPVVTGEFGEYDCATTYVPSYMEFADGKGISYLGWAWDTWPGRCGSGPALIMDSYVPATATPYGMGLKSHLAALNSMRDTHDFNGDAASDILWRDTSGNTAAWLMNGGQILQAGGYGQVPTTWSVVGQRNFDGDGNCDLLWRDTSGNTAIWLLNGLSVLQAAGIGNVPTTWSVAATADFNGDSKGDILWIDSTGNVAMWLMNGLSISQAGGLGNVSPWTVAGTADLNGDGNADILWKDMSGNVAIWLMNGLQISQTGSLGNVGTTWSIAGTGDFNGDGKADILWKDTSGNLAVWLMNGLQVTQAGGLGNVGMSWNVAQTGDYNGDGMSDVLWRDTSGNTAIWFMNGLQIGSTASLGNIPTSWTVQGMNTD
jgi:hypothetical protein